MTELKYSSTGTLIRESVEQAIVARFDDDALMHREIQEWLEDLRKPICDCRFNQLCHCYCDQCGHCDER